MYFDDTSLLPESQEKLVITVAPYGPQWLSSCFPEDIPVTMEDQVQKAVDCYNAGATVLHLHVREADGMGSKRLSKFNELIGLIREAVPKMIIQVGGSISFAPEASAEAKWLSLDTRHMLAELNPKPDQVTVVVNSAQMNIFELTSDKDAEGTLLEDPRARAAYGDLMVESSPSFFIEHLKRLRANNIQPQFMLGQYALESVERLIRSGLYMGPLNHTLVAFGGGTGGPDPFNIMDYVRRSPQGGILTLESWMRNVPQWNAMAIAMGLHCRAGIEDNLWAKPGQRVTSVQQIEQIVAIARLLGRDIASADEARQIMKIGTWYDSVDETLAALGMTPNREPGQRGFLCRNDMEAGVLSRKAA